MTDSNIRHGFIKAGKLQSQKRKSFSSRKYKRKVTEHSKMPPNEIKHHQTIILMTSCELSDVYFLNYYYFSKAQPRCYFTQSSIL